MSVDPRKVASARVDPEGICEEHANATGPGVVATGRWPGDALGVGAVVGPGDPCGLIDAEALGEGEAPAIATGVVLGACREIGAGLPQAESTSSAPSKAPFPIVALTVGTLGGYGAIS